MTLTAAGRAGAQGIPGKPDAQDIYLSFTYSGLVNAVITGIYYQDSVYIPIDAVFRKLRVDETIDIAGRTMKGFYIKPADKYALDFSKGIARVGGNRIAFDTSKVIVGQLDFYVLPSFFEKIFGLNVQVDFNSLSLILNTDQELPIVADYQRATRRNYSLVSPQAGIVQAPLAYPRERSMLNGGILDYSLSAFRAKGGSSYSYDLTGGGEVLGGETEGSLFGTVSNSQANVYSSTLSWKYAFDSLSYLTYAALGNLYTDGLTQYGFRGGQVSNQPLTVRTLFSQYVVNAETQPGWDIELYLNGQLVGFKRADSAGRAAFSIPLVYGTSFLQIKYYGPNGEFNESDRRLQIPFTFVPAGQLNYTASAGKLNNTEENLASVNVMYGLSDWMTDKVGVDYVDSPLFSQPLLYNSLYIRFSPQYMLSLDAAPSAYYKSTFSALYASQAAFDLSYGRYNQNTLYNPGGKIQEASGDIYVPFTFGRNSFNVRMAGTGGDYSGNLRSYSYSAYLSTNVSQLNASLGYLRSILESGGGGTTQTYSYTGSLLYSLFFHPGAFHFLNGTLINVTGRYGVLKNSLDDISLQISKNVQRFVRISFSAEKNYVNNATTFNLQIIADLPFTRSTTSAQVQNGEGSYSQNLSGSIGFDSHYSHFLFTDLGWVGHSAASMRMFVDENGNNKYDKGEEVIKDGQITLRQAVATETSQGGIIRDWNLLPYTRYSADVNLASINNPLWIPKEKSFSFITDPNSYKRIDIPFYVGGIVDGRVLRLEDGKETSVPGLSLEIRSDSTGKTRTVSVFNDGSFYYMGLPPGHYEARVDSNQLAVLGVYSDPPVIHFTVKPTKNGDFIEGLRITLKSMPPQETTQEIPPPEKAAPRPSLKPTAPGYVVQIGAFTAPERARKLAKWARIMTGQVLQERLNTGSGLYVVQTDTFERRETALERLDVLMNKFGFFDAFVSSTGDTATHYLFSVQLAAFKSVSHASEFATRITRETGLQCHVQFRRSISMISVLAGPYTSLEEAKRIMDRLQQRNDIRNAFIVITGETDIPRMYAVSLGTFPSENLARWFARAFRWRTGVIGLVGFDREKLEFRVFTPAFRTNEEALAVLGRIKTFGSYSKAQLISLP